MRKHRVPEPGPGEMKETTAEGLHRRERGPEKPKAGNIDAAKGKRKKR